MKLFSRCGKVRTREACTLEAALVLTLFDFLSLLQIITNSSRCTVQCSWSVNLGLLYFRLEKKDTAGGVVRHACNKHSEAFLITGRMRKKMAHAATQLDQSQDTVFISFILYLVLHQSCKMLILFPVMLTGNFYTTVTSLFLWKVPAGWIRMWPQKKAMGHLAWPVGSKGSWVCLEMRGWSGRKVEGRTQYSHNNHCWNGNILYQQYNCCSWNC